MTTRIPKSSSASYRASVHIHSHGPLTADQLFAAVNCGIKPSNRQLMLESALRTGWLIEVAGLIDIGETARAHFDGDGYVPKVVEPIGQMATVRTGTVYDRPPLSKRFIPSSRGTRDDVPAYSVRDGVRFSTLGGRS